MWGRRGKEKGCCKSRNEKGREKEHKVIYRVRLGYVSIKKREKIRGRKRKIEYRRWNGRRRRVEG